MATYAGRSQKAEKFIFLEYYIVEEGLMWNSILDILEQKAAQGVEIKMLYDDIGCMATLPGDYTIQLRSRGIEAHKFNKVIPSFDGGLQQSGPS